MDFPSHPKIEEVEKMLGSMRELFANELFKTAQFYERTKKAGAALIYYSKIISKYPGTETAIKSQKRIKILAPKVESKIPEIKVHKKEGDLVVEASEVESVK